MNMMNYTLCARPTESEEDPDFVQRDTIRNQEKEDQIGSNN